MHSSAVIAAVVAKAAISSPIIVASFFVVGLIKVWPLSEFRDHDAELSIVTKRSAVVLLSVLFWGKNVAL